MTRKAPLVLALLVFASLTYAGTRIESGARISSGATVGGLVTAVDGTLIHLAGGAITIDASGAKINGTIEPGVVLLAIIKTTDVAPNAPLPAETINATPLPDGTLFGPVQSVDLASNTLTLLGRTIHVNGDTSFGGMHKSRDSEKPGLDDILPNQLVTVTVDAADGQLLARSVLLLAPTPPEVRATRGVVKSIGADSWVITQEKTRDVPDLTVLIDAQTKIVGSPKVGDTVELLYRVDSSNAFVAISIVRFEPPKLPDLDIFRFSGRVDSIAPDQWVVSKTEGGEKVTLKIDRNSKVDPGVEVGDRVEVLAQRNSDGTITALAIVRRFF
jgi:hypothetical protein